MYKLKNYNIFTQGLAIRRGEIQVYCAGSLGPKRAKKRVKRSSVKRAKRPYSQRPCIVNSAPFVLAMLLKIRHFSKDFSRPAEGVYYGEVGKS